MATFYPSVYSDVYKFLLVRFQSFPLSHQAHILQGLLLLLDFQSIIADGCFAKYSWVCQNACGGDFVFIPSDWVQKSHFLLASRLKAVPQCVPRPPNEVHLQFRPLNCTALGCIVSGKATLTCALYIVQPWLQCEKYMKAADIARINCPLWIGKCHFENDQSTSHLEGKTFPFCEFEEQNCMATAPFSAA